MGNSTCSEHSTTPFQILAEGRVRNKFGAVGTERVSFARAGHRCGGRASLRSDVKGIQVFDSDGRYLETFKVMASRFGMSNDKNELRSPHARKC